MANFKGFKQVTLSEYNSIQSDERKNYIWFVRNIVNNEVLGSSIYFGNREYANLGDTALSNKVDNIIAALGGAVDENGDFVGFLPFEDHEILGSVESGLTQALEALEAAILANRDRITALETDMGDVQENISLTQSALTVEIEARQTADQELEERIEDLEGIATVTATTYAEAVEMELQPGQIVYVMQTEPGESGHTAGAYIYLSSGLKKLDTSSGDGSTVLDRVEALEAVVGDDPLPVGETLTSMVNDLMLEHVITGDDVEDDD